MKFLRQGVLLFAGSLGFAAFTDAGPWWLHGAESNQNQFLPPDEAFRVAAREDGGHVRVRWVIADGYYLYRARMEIKAESPDLEVAAPDFPHGTIKNDPYLGTQEVFKQQVEGSAAISRSDRGAHPIEIKVIYQGCADAGLCYPPIIKVMFPTRSTQAAAQTPEGGRTLDGRRAPGGGGAAGVRTAPHPWEAYAIFGGILAFLLAGLALRKGRRLASPV